MILRSGGADDRVKSLLDDAWPYPVIPPEFLGAGGLSGVSADPVWPFQSIEQAMGLPALLGILLRLSTACGMLPQKVYAGDDQLDRHVATDSWQYGLLHDRPGEEHTPFTLRADMAMAIAGMGYCCVRAFQVPDSDVPGGKRVAELLPLDSRRITPKRKNGRLVFEDRTEGEMVERTTDEIIYIRAPATNGSVRGLAPISLARMGLMTALKRQVFEGRYYDRNAEPRVVLAFPQTMPQSEAEEWVDMWDDRHQGLANAHNTAAIGGGATVTTVPISLVDAQFVEGSRWTADQWGFIYGMPKSFLNTAERSTMTDNDWRYFTTFGLGWIMHAIDNALTASRLLFPRGGDRMHVETVLDAFLKPDIQTRYEAYKAARQAGWLTANEIRALENYPPKTGGDELQATPVGGAPNTAAAVDAAKALDELENLFELDGTAEQQEILARARRRMIEAVST
jgi:HK97 family phage portal protein